MKRAALRGESLCIAWSLATFKSNSNTHPLIIKTLSSVTTLLVFRLANVSEEVRRGLLGSLGVCVAVWLETCRGPFFTAVTLSISANKQPAFCFFPFLLEPPPCSRRARSGRRNCSRLNGGSKHVSLETNRCAVSTSPSQ